MRMLYALFIFIGFSFTGFVVMMNKSATLSNLTVSKAVVYALITTAVNAMALLAGGFSCPVKMHHCLPGGLTTRQQRIIRSLFYQLSEIFTSSSFDVSMEAAPVSQFAEELAH